MARASSVPPPIEAPSIKATDGNGSKPIREMKGVLETLFLYHYVHHSQADLVIPLTKTLKKMLLDGTTRKLRREAYQELLSEE